MLVLSEKPPFARAVSPQEMEPIAEPPAYAGKSEQSGQPP
jgi:hypothetical protein